MVCIDALHNIGTRYTQDFACHKTTKTHLKLKCSSSVINYFGRTFNFPFQIPIWT